jgi:predicted nucleic acid-binding protein
VILVETSVWIEVFRARRPLDLKDVLDFGDVVTCLPVIHAIAEVSALRHRLP